MYCSITKTPAHTIRVRDIVCYPTQLHNDVTREYIIQQKSISILACAQKRGNFTPTPINKEKKWKSWHTQQTYVTICQKNSINLCTFIPIEYTCCTMHTANLTIISIHFYRGIVRTHAHKLYFIPEAHFIQLFGRQREYYTFLVSFVLGLATHAICGVLFTSSL